MTTHHTLRLTRSCAAEGRSARWPKPYVTLRVVSTDTKAIIGTIVGTGLALAGLLSAQIAGVNARVDDVRADMSEMRGDMREMRASMERFDARLDAVEVAFGKVEQRLDTLERVLLPSREPVGE